MSMKKSIEVFLEWKPNMSSNEIDLLVDFLSEVYDKERTDFVECVNRQYRKMNKTV